MKTLILADEKDYSLMTQVTASFGQIYLPKASDSSSSQQKMKERLKLIEEFFCCNEEEKDSAVFVFNPNKSSLPVERLLEMNLCVKYNRPILMYQEPIILDNQIRELFNELKTLGIIEFMDDLESSPFLLCMKYTSLLGNSKPKLNYRMEQAE